MDDNWFNHAYQRIKNSPLPRINSDHQYSHIKHFTWSIDNNRKNQSNVKFYKFPVIDRWHFINKIYLLMQKHIANRSIFANLACALKPWTVVRFQNPKMRRYEWYTCTWHCDIYHPITNYAHDVSGHTKSGSEASQTAMSTKKTPSIV